ncbi:hypothetical protein KUL17_29270 [Alteromonas sp. KUL17]|uniref:hypothetical protein n=1 Tax=Alteromonas sp. KUL17 TaxID=2480796 RepID=UPI0010371C16|nr:hypothetical protein [Alteromonas sp. KUL17]TAP24559.1 hypothetical protein KUL49_14555 [Alteromonas sp. KUL17]GEA04030.1 hypothetical protein KUL17_29270 [Alteromonas sp. KUL17]
MSDLLQIVKGLSMQPKCVLVLGARTEAMLNWLFSLTATEVVLVEPEPAMFEKATLLHNAKGSPESVVIKHGVPAFDAKQKSMRYFVSNVPGYSSVLPPNVIKSIRPALEFTEQDAAVIELQPLLQQFDISESRPCLLVSQVNGAEQQCLNNQVLNAFTHVVIQSSLKPVFGETKPVEKLKKQFTECGRDYLVLAESMPPYSNFVATKKVHAEQALSYFSQRQQHREIKVALENQLNASQSDVKKITEELQQAKEQLQTAQQQSKGKLKQLGDELQQTKHQLQAAKQQSGEKQKQLSDELQQVKQNLLAEKQRFEESKASLNNELALQKQTVETVCSEKDKQRKELLEKIEHVQNSERKQIAALELTSKLNLKLQTDLDALRVSYAKKAKDETELKELVNELYAKLKHASKFYYELEKKYPELIEEQRG